MLLMCLKLFNNGLFGVGLVVVASCGLSMAVGRRDYVFKRK